MKREIATAGVFFFFAPAPVRKSLIIPAGAHTTLKAGCNVAFVGRLRVELPGGHAHISDSLGDLAVSAVRL